MNSYLAELIRAPNDSTAELRLDLGFHIQIVRRLTIDRARAVAGDAGDDVTLKELGRRLENDSLLLVAATDTDNAGNYRATLDLLSEEELDDNGLWHYRAHTPRVIDGDTIDAVIDLGFGIEITERLRFKGIQAPEIFGVPTAGPEYERGMEAKRYVERRLSENDSKFEVATTKRGKWRRWLADLHLPDATATLNEELIDQGLATDFDAWLEQRRRRQVVRTVFDIDRDLRDELTVRAKAEEKTPAQLLRSIVERFLTE